jgi:hypothetical protein
VPPVTTAAIAASTALSVARPRALVVPATYAAAVVVAAWRTGSTIGSRARLVAVFPTMHLCWGAGFLAGAVGDGSV